MPHSPGVDVGLERRSARGIELSYVVEEPYRPEALPAERWSPSAARPGIRIGRRDVR